MEKLFSFILENKEWLFSGIGVAVVGLVLSLLRIRIKRTYPKDRARDVHISGKGIDEKLSIKGTKDISAEIRGVVDKAKNKSWLVSILADNMPFKVGPTYMKEPKALK